MTSQHNFIQSLRLTAKVKLWIELSPWRIEQRKNRHFSVLQIKWDNIV